MWLHHREFLSCALWCFRERFLEAPLSCGRWRVFGGARSSVVSRIGQIQGTEWRMRFAARIRLFASDIRQALEGLFHFASDSRNVLRLCNDPSGVRHLPRADL